MDRVKGAGRACILIMFLFLFNRPVRRWFFVIVLALPFRYLVDYHLPFICCWFGVARAGQAGVDGWEELGKGMHMRVLVVGQNSGAPQPNQASIWWNINCRKRYVKEWVVYIGQTKYSAYPTVLPPLINWFSDIRIIESYSITRHRRRLYVWKKAFSELVPVIDDAHKSTRLICCRIHVREIRYTSTYICMRRRLINLVEGILGKIYKHLNSRSWSLNYYFWLANFLNHKIICAVPVFIYLNSFR